MDWLIFAAIATAGLSVGAVFMHLLKRAEQAALEAKIDAWIEPTR